VITKKTIYYMSKRRLQDNWGLCTNNDMDGEGNPCPKCSSKELQRISHNHKFECSECGSPLTKVPPPQTWWDKYKWFVIAPLAAVVLGGCIFGVVALTGDSEKSTKQETNTVVTVDSDSIKVAQMIIMDQKVKDTINAVVSVDSDSIKASLLAAENQRLKDSLAAVEAANAKKKETPIEKPSVAPVSTSRPTSPVSSKKNLGYAIFKGSWPNDVNGRMEFKSSHVIDSRDPKGRVAEPGDYVIGEWSEGHLVQGIWYGADNQVKGSVIIGK